MKASETISVTLSPDLAKTLRESVAAGEFATTNDAARNAIEQWQRARLANADAIDAIRSRLRKSMEDPRPSLGFDQAEDEMNRFMAISASTVPDAAR
jgi:antitoxin ParD1/3/4